MAWAVEALFGISLGTVYQKRHGTHVELVVGTIIQYAAASLFFALGAFAWEFRAVEWNLQLQLSMASLVLGVSIGAILLLASLVRHGAANRVASLFYLVPPLIALETVWTFDERLGWLAMSGGVVSIIGVALVAAPGVPKRGAADTAKGFGQRPAQPHE